MTITTPLLTIDGRACGSSESLPVIDPSTAEPFIEIPAASPAQLDEAVAAANAAFPAWRATPLPRRQEIVRGFRDVVTAHIDELALLVSTEQGKPLANARGEIGAALRQVDFFTTVSLDPEVIRDDETGRVEVRRTPVGVVGAITVWNYPILTAMFKIVPALVAGNVVIVKPSPFTPVATLRLGEVLQELLPPGVVQVVAGTDELGAALTTHPGVHKISFTGSVETGKRVMAAAAGTLKRVTLELGGNDAGIVLDDAVARANDTTYGLGASVWSPDLDRAATVAERLDAGSVWVNQHPVVTATVPFGGAKQSGIGVEGSLHGLHAYTDIKVFNTKR